jgi:hypothetical protein
MDPKIWQAAKSDGVFCNYLATDGKTIGVNLKGYS